MTSTSSSTSPSLPKSSVPANDERAMANAAMAQIGNTTASSSLVESHAPATMDDPIRKGDIAVAEATEGSEASTMLKDGQGGNAAGRALDEFTLFPKLPVELRLRIWKHTLPAGRVVELIYHGQSLLVLEDEESNISSLETIGHLTTSTRPPTTLFICQESRREALRYYQLTFGGSSWTGEVYFDFSVDDLLMTCSGWDEDYSSMGAFVKHAKGFENVQTIIDCGGVFTSGEQNLQHLRKRLPALKGLIMVDHPDSTTGTCLHLEMGYGPASYIDLNQVSDVENLFGFKVLFGQLLDDA